MVRHIIKAVVIALTLVNSAQAQVQDTIFRKTPLLTGNDALLFGAFTLTTALVAPLDREVASRLQNPRTQESRFLRTAATGFRLLGDPGSLLTGAGLYLLGRADGQLRTQALGLHSVEAILIAGVLGGGIKAVAGRQRPYVDIKNPYSFQLGRGLRDDKYRSFPSGHTFSAFAFASTVSRETVMWAPRSRWYVGTVMYGGAAMIGLSRMYNNQHWASDVLGGAAIGTLVGLKVVKYTHSNPNNHIDKALLKAGRKQVAPPPFIAFTIHF